MDLETYWRTMRATYVQVLRAELRYDHSHDVQHHAELVAARRQHNHAKAEYIREFKNLRAGVDSTDKVAHTEGESESEQQEEAK